MGDLAHPAAIKLRSEDGRAVTGVHLTPFVHDLLRDVSSGFFIASAATGPTRRAAVIREALEVSAKVPLLGEETAAINLLLWAARMQRLVEHETTTPPATGYASNASGMGSRRCSSPAATAIIQRWPTGFLLQGYGPVHVATTAAQEAVRKRPSGGTGQHHPPPTGGATATRSRFVRPPHTWPGQAAGQGKARI